MIFHHDIWYVDLHIVLVNAGDGCLLNAPLCHSDEAKDTIEDPAADGYVQPDLESPEILVQVPHMVPAADQSDYAEDDVSDQECFVPAVSNGEHGKCPQADHTQHGNSSLLRKSAEA